jgi:hypothetical protein
LANFSESGSYLVMQVYVIAASPDGPSKIGVAIYPERRMRGLQTGTHAPLKLYHAEPIGIAAKTVERAVHNALSTRRAGGGREWFDVTTKDATALVKDTAARFGVLITDQTKKLGELERQSAIRWLCKRADEDEDEISDISPPTITRLLAGNIQPRSAGRFTFNDYLLTWNEGMRLRWAFERLGRRMPNGKLLKPYLEADVFLEREDVKYGREIDFRWMEWSVGRDLRLEEANALAKIWDKFVPLYNDLGQHGPQHPTYGIDDHVDDVHLFCLKRDKDRGDRDCVVFLHKDFRAVLIPKKDTRLDPTDGELCLLGAVAVSGFVAAPIPLDIWDKPIQPWLQNASEHRNTALGTFLGAPNKRYPGRRRYNGIPSSPAWVRNSLDCVEEDGCF